MERRKTEREETYALIDQTATLIPAAPEVLQKYLNAQTQFDRYSTSNALLVAAQRPTATRLGDFNRWKEDGVFVKRNEKGIAILEPGKEFEREDGTIGVGYNVKRVFDITQTNAKPQKTEPKPEISAILKALVQTSPVPIRVVEAPADNRVASYLPDENAIVVAKGQDAASLVHCVAQEIAYASLVRADTPPDVDPDVLSYCASYMVSKKFGLDTKSYVFSDASRSFDGLDAKLNSEHIIPPRDYYYQQNGREDNGFRNHRWNDVTVKKMLRNEVYLGHMIQNKRGTLSYKNKKQVDKPKEDWIKVQNTHEAIIDIETWNACVELDARNLKPRPTKKTNEISLFGGLLKCMDCGFAMRYSQETHDYPKSGRVTYISYMCGNYARSGKSACSAHIIYLKPLAELVLNDIHHRAGRVLENEDRVRQELTASKAKQGAQQMKTDKTTLKATEKRLAELERLTQVLYEDKVLGSVPEAVFQKLMTTYEAERTEKLALVHEVKQRFADTVQDAHDIEQYIQSIKKYVAIEQLDREMLLELIHYIEIGERQVIDGQKCRDMVIHYNLVDKAG